MTDHPARGWLPIDFDFDPQPAVVPGGSVRWREFGETPLAEPFFRQTLERMEQPVRPVEIDTSIESMLRMSDRLPEVLPSGFIFHISHCGSTLVANALKGASSTVVAAEATPFVRLARWYPEAPSAYLRRRWARTRKQLFESLFRLFAHYRTGATERLVVKFASLNLFGMRFVRDTWPDVPCVLIVRDPAEVLVSSLGENGWLAHKGDPDLAGTLYGWTDPPFPFSGMSDEEYCGRLLGRHLAAALEATDERCKVVDYEDLNRARMREIASFFGLELPLEPENLAKTFGVYSKDPTGTLGFQNDRALKRCLASRPAVAAAREWAMPAYIELRSRGVW
jgi:hypothetical protein